MTRPFVPKFILDAYRSEIYEGSFPAATLFVDISGFTTLTETLIRHEKEGAEALTDALKALFEPLVSQVYARGGMIPLFAGDAFTAVFPQDAQNPIQAILNTLNTACVIQGDFADHQIQTQYGNFTMGIKIGLSLGELQWGIPRHEDKATFYFRGEAMNQSAQCQQQANTGEIIIDEAMLPYVADYVSVERLEAKSEFYRLTSCTLKTAAASKPLPEYKRSLLEEFISPTVLDLQLEGEFREICPVFISFDAPAETQPLHKFISTVISLATRYGGTMSQLDFGDKGSLIVLWFGAPMTYENNIERAAQYLLALQEANQKLTHSVRWRASMTFGIVWAGIRGGIECCEYGAVGDVVNLAARIVTKSRWGEIWVSKPVFDRIKNGYRFETLGAFQFKGKRQQSTIYQLLLAAQQSEISFSTEKMIGRQKELMTLRREIQPIFDGYSAGVIYIYGEAGMGKSRLLYELHKQLNRRYRLNWFHCPAEEILRQSLNPFTYFLYRYFNQSLDKTTEQCQSAFDDTFYTLLDRIYKKYPLDDIEAHDIIEQLERTRSFLAAMVGLRWSDSLYSQLEPKLRFQNTLVAFKNLIMAESLLQPVIIEMEDAHWLDDDSKELVSVLTKGIAGYPIVLIFSGRYGDDGSKFKFDFEPDVTQFELALQDLSETDVQMMAESIVQGELTSDTVAFLMQKCNGNPFFVEQISLDLKERGLLAKAANNGHFELLTQRINEVPSNINAVLIARLDRLTAEVKHVVQTAAVLGREFELLILDQMLDNDTQLTTKIKTAENAQIWDTLNNIRYIFKHALLRDSAYDMQLRARLRELHNSAAQAIENVHQTDLQSHYADIAYHYDRADIHSDAAHWYRQAGEQAIARFANEEAITYFARALSLLDEADYETRFSILLIQEESHALLGKREAQYEDLVVLGDLTGALDDDWRRVEVAIRLTKYAEMTSDYPAAIAAARMSVNLARELHHREGEAEGYLLLGRAQWRKGDFDDSLKNLEMALSLARKSGLQEVEADALRNMGIVFIYRGNFADAESQSELALQIYRKVGIRSGENAALNNLGEILLEEGRFERSFAYYEQALAICRQTGERRSEQVIRHNMGRSLLQQGDFMGAKAALEESLQIAYDVDDLQGEGETLGELGKLYLFLGQYDVAQSYFEESLQISGEIGDLLVEAYVLAHLGLLFLRKRDTAVSWEYCQQALRLLESVNDNRTEALALSCFGQVLVGVNQYRRAIEPLQQALSIRQELVQPHRAVEVLAGLARAYSLQGKEEQALQYARQIWQHVQERNLLGTQEPFEVLLVCYDVFAVAGEETAVSVLSYMLAELQKQADAIYPKSLRETFLHQILAHQRILYLEEAIE